MTCCLFRVLLIKFERYFDYIRVHVLIKCFHEVTITLYISFLVYNYANVVIVTLNYGIRIVKATVTNRFIEWHRDNGICIRDVPIFKEFLRISFNNFPCHGKGDL